MEEDEIEKKWQCNERVKSFEEDMCKKLRVSEGELGKGVSGRVWNQMRQVMTRDSTLSDPVREEQCFMGEKYE